MTSHSKTIRWYEPTFQPIMELVEREAKLAGWGNSEGMRVIAQAKFGVKISKFEGVWRKITVEDEQKYAWLLLKI
jgi:hypothetical protein